MEYETELDRLITEVERLSSKDDLMYGIYQHLILLKDIMNSGDCNTCTSQSGCPIAPKPGERVRYNCAFYKGGDK